MRLLCHGSVALWAWGTIPVPTWPSARCTQRAVEGGPSPGHRPQAVTHPCLTPPLPFLPLRLSLWEVTWALLPPALPSSPPGLLLLWSQPPASSLTLTLTLPLPRCVLGSAVSSPLYF